jgi:cysteine desulfurase
MHGQKQIYLDYNATTPLDPRVLEAMLPYMKEHFGNAASSQHAWGWAAQKGLEKARSQAAQLLCAQGKEIFFTSGATESNNWVFQGLYHQHLENKSDKKFHVLTSAAEHSSVLAPAEFLAKIGAEVEFVPVNKWGQVEVEDVAKRIRPETKLMSFMWVNNEVGSINPIPELARLAREKEILFHTDATQAVGKLKIDLYTVPVDLLTFSAHKIYGPKGMGALYVRSSKDRRIELPALIKGGAQERGYRAGTVNVSAAVGFGRACEICFLEMASEMNQMYFLQDRFMQNLTKEVPGIRMNGHPTQRVCTNLNLTFSDLDLEKAASYLVRLGFSSGSACHSGSTQGSHVLTAMGFNPMEISQTIRLSVGRLTTAEELSEAVSIFKNAFLQSQKGKEYQDLT